MVRSVIMVFGLLLASPGQAACLTDRPEAERWGHIAVASQGCSNFPRLQINDFVGWVTANLSTKDKRCGDEVRDMLKILAAPRLDENFCREARRRRDFAIGTPGRKTIPELIDAARGKLRPGEQVVGTWVDRDHMCGVVTITRRANAHSHFAMCSDGSSTRRGDGPVDKAAAALEQIKAPAGASRAWQTPGLTRRDIVLLGERTVEYLDRKGHRYDLNRFVEMRDGRLLGYQSGVGLDRDGPWLRAEPWNAN